MNRPTVSVQFVCLGNICRSPAAQGVMERLVRERGLEDRILVDSAGTADYHIGRNPDRRMIAAAARRGIDLRSTAKQYQAGFAAQRTFVLAMDHDNLDDILRVTEGRSGRTSSCNTDSHLRSIRLFSDFLDESWPRNVPDPYYGGEDGFEYVLDMLEAGCPKVLEQLEHALQGKC